MGEAINLVNKLKVEKVIFTYGKFNELEQKLKSENIKLESKYNKKHYENGKKEKNGFVKLDNTKMIEYTYVVGQVEDYQY